MLDELIRKFEI